MTSPQKRSKRYGYAVEVAALKALRVRFPRLERTGSVAYKKAAADLVQTAVVANPTVNAVVTRDKGHPLLVTMSVDDFTLLASSACDHVGLRVQVKAREKTWIGRVWRDLRGSK